MGPNSFLVRGLVAWLGEESVDINDVLEEAPLVLEVRVQVSRFCLTQTLLVSKIDHDLLPGGHLHVHVGIELCFALDLALCLHMTGLFQHVLEPVQRFGLELSLSFGLLSAGQKLVNLHVGLHVLSENALDLSV